APKTGHAHHRLHSPVRGDGLGRAPVVDAPTLTTRQPATAVAQVEPVEVRVAAPARTIPGVRPGASMDARPKPDPRVRHFAMDRLAVLRVPPRPPPARSPRARDGSPHAAPVPAPAPPSAPLSPHA